MVSKTPRSQHDSTSSAPKRAFFRSPIRSTVYILLLLLAAFLLTGSAENSLWVDGELAAEGLVQSFESVDQIDAERLRHFFDEMVHQKSVDERILNLYSDRSYEPIWWDQDASAAAERLAEALDVCPSAIFPPEIEPARLRAALRWMNLVESRPTTLAEVEHGLTAAYFACADHLATRPPVEPAELGWDVSTPERPDLRQVFTTALEEGRIDRIAAALAEAPPLHPQADRLTQAWARYRDYVVQGGWTTVPDGPTLEPGEPAPRQRLVALAERLQGEDFLEEIEIGELYDGALVDAVKRFQSVRGLAADGKLGSKTVAALNVPAQKRLEQIELNVERARWLPAPDAEREVWVNVAAYRLSVLENGETVEEMAVMVGKPSWKTPIFEDKIEYLVVNPAWNVPASIAIDEVVGKLKRNPEGAMAEGFEVYHDGQRVDPRAVNWDGWTKRNFPYHIRQKPGPRNPLGQVKFIFPNKHNVYLHDTSASPALFEKPQRAFSHGCVRVERPFDLAAALLSPLEHSMFLTKLENGERETIYLDEPVPVTLIYMTAWVRDDGTVELWDDVYSHDQKLEQVLASTGRKLGDVRA